MSESKGVTLKEKQEQEHMTKVKLNLLEGWSLNLARSKAGISDCRYGFLKCKYPEFREYVARFVQSGKRGY